MWSFTLLLFADFLDKKKEYCLESQRHLVTLQRARSLKDFSRMKCDMSGLVSSLMNKFGLFGVA
jgi:hypothetical protein